MDRDPFHSGSVRQTKFDGAAVLVAGLRRDPFAADGAASGVAGAMTDLDTGKIDQLGGLGGNRTRVRTSSLLASTRVSVEPDGSVLQGAEAPPPSVTACSDSDRQSRPRNFARASSRPVDMALAAATGRRSRRRERDGSRPPSKGTSCPFVFRDGFTRSPGPSTRSLELRNPSKPFRALNNGSLPSFYRPQWAQFSP